MLLTLAVSLLFVTASVQAHRLDHYSGNAEKVPFKDESVLEMYQKWVDTGLSSLMAAFANNK